MGDIVDESARNLRVPDRYPGYHESRGVAGSEYIMFQVLLIKAVGEERVANEIEPMKAVAISMDWWLQESIVKGLRQKFVAHPLQ